MKTIKNFILYFLLLFTQAAFSQKYALTVEALGISPTHGKLEIALYNKSSDFPKKYFEFKKTIQVVSSGKVKYIFSDLPPGDYAVAVFHDENSDGECNTNFLGIPTEGYGFSNNVVPLFSAPSFGECKINLDKNKTVSIKLIY